jgi:toxin YoeB
MRADCFALEAITADVVVVGQFAAAGKPEPLKFLLAGCWSRRITREHRLVYCVTADRINFLQARYHYE